MMEAGSRAVRVAERRRAQPINWRLLIIGAIAIIPRMLGIAVGTTARIIALVIAAGLDGFEHGYRGPARDTPVQSSGRPVSAVTTRE
jgi:hypothetical protein